MWGVKVELLLDGKPVITKTTEVVTPNTLTLQELTFDLPANVTTDNNANVKNLQLIVTHPSVPIMSKNINFGSKHILKASQSVMIVKDRNIGATNIGDQGSLFQFQRPNIFGKNGIVRRN